MRCTRYVKLFCIKKHKTYKTVSELKRLGDLADQTFAIIHDKQMVSLHFCPELACLKHANGGKRLQNVKTFEPGFKDWVQSHS